MRRAGPGALCGFQVGWFEQQAASDSDVGQVDGQLRAIAVGGKVIRKVGFLMDLQPGGIQAGPESLRSTAREVPDFPRARRPVEP